MSGRNRVILIYPSNPNESEKPDRPPLGILTVAAPLVKLGIEVCLLDERAEKNFDEKLARELKKQPVCVGISSMSGRHIHGAMRVSKLVRERSTVPIVWGGVHPSLEPKSTVQHDFVDIVVRDDGEETFPKLFACLQEPVPNLERVRGIGFQKDGHIIMTEPAEPANIENLPLIPFHLVDFKNYEARESIPWMSGNSLLAIETSRGCPFSCSFCTESVRKKKWRALSPKRVLNDITQYVQQYGIKNFTFIDDNFFGDVKRGEKIIEELVQKELGIRWYTNIRADYMARASHEFIAKLEKSGCGALTFGAESGSERILNMINKHASIEDIIQSNRKLAHSKISPHFVTIRGFPTETSKDIVQTYLLNIQLLLENKRAICDSPFLIPTPGTIIAKQCLQERLDSYTLEDWAQIFDLEFSGGRPPWVLKETFSTIQRYARLQEVIWKTNRIAVPLLRNTLYHVFLRMVRIALRLGFR